MARGTHLRIVSRRPSLIVDLSRSEPGEFFVEPTPGVPSRLAMGASAAATLRALGIQVYVADRRLALRGRVTPSARRLLVQHGEDIVHSLVVGVPVELDRNLRACGASWPFSLAKG